MFFVKFTKFVDIRNFLYQYNIIQNNIKRRYVSEEQMREVVKNKHNCLYTHVIGNYEKK